MAKIIYSPSKKIRGISAFEDFSYSIIETPVNTSSSQSNVGVNDQTISRVVPSGSKNNYKININPSFKSTNYSFESKSVNSTVDLNGNVVWVSNGSSEINIKTTSLGMKRISRPIINSSTTYDIFLNWNSGSLCNHIETAISNYLSGKTPSSTTLQFYEQSGAYPNTSGDFITSNAYFKPNTNRFCNNLNLNAFSVGNFQNMTLISPRHVIGSHLSGTGTIIFRDDAGNYQVRTVISILGFSSNGQTQADAHYVGLLDSPITTITPIKFLPTAYNTKIKTSSISTTPFQVMRKKQAGGINIELMDCNLVSPNNLSAVTLRKSVRSPYSSWSTSIEGGDSNGQIFVPIDSANGTNYEAVLIGSMNNTGGTRSYSLELAQIQSLMNTLVTGYTLQTISLAAFNSY